ncbi:MAG: ThuA domain-containing protein [Verrucomicrobiota bacterium]
MKTANIKHSNSILKLVWKAKRGVIRRSMFLVACLLFSFCLVPTFSLTAAEPLRALLITGGCCHDYPAQKKTLSEGISARANVTWTIVHEGDSAGREHKMSVYEKPDWAKGYDVIVHNECFGKVTNIAFIEQIVRAHTNGVPAVMIHCSMHSYRETTSDEWRKLLGVSSYRHQPKRAFKVITVKADHPIMKGFPETWQDAEDELYEIKKVWPNCVPLAKSLTPDNEQDQHVSIWVNTYGNCRVFGTTLGHLNDTIKTDLYLDLVTRGLLWSCDKLDKNGKPKSGYEKKS